MNGYFYPGFSAIITMFLTPISMTITFRLRCSILKQVISPKNVSLLSEKTKTLREHLISPKYEASIEFVRRALLLFGKTRPELSDIMASFRKDKAVIKFDEEQ